MTYAELRAASLSTLAQIATDARRPISARMAAAETLHARTAETTANVTAEIAAALRLDFSAATFA